MHDLIQEIAKRSEFFPTLVREKMSERSNSELRSKQAFPSKTFGLVVVNLW